MDRNSPTISHTYQVHGDGGQGACIAVQSVLQEHGLCGYTEWHSPEWQFLYLTHLEVNAVAHLLGDLTNHFKIIIKNGNTHA
jgi:hypothetical protein